MYDPTQVVFGLDRALRMTVGHKPRRVAMPEGEFDVIAAQAAGVPAVAPGTVSISDRQLWLLRAHVDEIAFMFDAGAGDDAVWGKDDPDTGKRYKGHVERLFPYFKLYECPVHEGDPASMTSDEVRALYAGAEHWLRVAFSA